jgi:4-carboxymuconolactone decarboxylase
MTALRRVPARKTRPRFLQHGGTHAISDEKVATIIAGQRPGDLTREEAVAYDMAAALVAGGVLPALTYQQAVDLFGEGGTAEFINLVGLYCMVSVTLNGYDVPVPEFDEPQRSAS